MPRFNQPNRTILIIFLLLFLFSFACQTPAPPDTRSADENTLRTLDEQWSKAAGAKDVEKTISYYTDDAIVMPQNSPPLTSKEQIRAMWKTMFGAPNFSGGWKSTKIEVARSGDLGYVSGNYEMNENDTTGKPITDRGKYLEIWKKQADGSWKCVVDMFSSDLPPQAPVEKQATEKNK